MTEVDTSFGGTIGGSTLADSPRAGWRLPIFGRLAAWKFLILQDILILGAFGAAAVWYPATLLSMQAKIAGFIGWPPASWLAKSDTISMLVGGIGCVALGYCVQLLYSVLTEDTNFAASLAIYHSVLGCLLYYCLMVGGSSHKVLVPFIIHNVLTAGGLFMTLPAGKLRNLFGKVHVA